MRRARAERLQRGLALLAAGSSLMTGLDVAYEHYRGSYSRRVMYTPVVLSGALAAAGVYGFFNRHGARAVLRPVAVATLADGAIGFCFHVRGIARKPGGWRLPLTNMIMGPPVFAPLLFGLSAYLGLLGSYSPRELRAGRLHPRVAAVTAGAALCSGVEAFYSHYKNNFRYKAQWTPILLAPLLMAASLGSVKSPAVARRWLPAVSAAAVADGGLGFFYHARGVLRRPGGRRHLLYNIMYGPPVLAPLLFAACGALGLLASLLWSER